ncbi:hypothetical protein JX265_001137 [Neoarthrinium moseri]|uniref:Zn(2)-C6 fungal-type domain-containing protein n=1 Tax=Neoarthrinium moseri TaxID=1658444 RepID=A0A9Q0ARM0_9PEZI|nr:uncharacterized protein JN550_007311 [Neoarthrinium moseri]KAI1866764.1 hypothetical protein JN550_007311 [Neoarthrinium moseri]KAI1880897.1 hypothetical protein JX265_001137 [Neoarthrinium moseri]
MSLSPSRSLPAVSATAADQPHRKRIRLSLACNQCRKRKVRCDTTLPKCRNCILRNEDCQTTDPRNPTKGLSVRTWATKDGSGPGDWDRDRRMSHFGAGSQTSGTGPGAGTPPESSLSDLSPRPHRRASIAGGGEKGTSWQERAYRENTMGNGANPLPASTPDLVVNTDDTAYRVKFLGGSSIQCLCRFVDLHLAHRGLEPASGRFKHGMRQSEEMSLPLTLSLPELPAVEELKVYVDAFFDRVWPLFPVVDCDAVQAEIDNILDIQIKHPGSLASRLAPTSIPMLAIVYAIVCIGADETSRQLSDLSTRFLTGAYSLIAHLIAIPYLTSVQALFLISLALRGQVKDGQAWHVLGQAIRTAHSIGLHKQVMRRGEGAGEASQGYRTDAQLHQRIWWSLYALEKLTQLECGRPSTICDHDEDQVPMVPTVFAPNARVDIFTAWVSLACIMGQISDHIYSRKPESSLDLFSKTASLDKALVEWERSLPDHLKQGQSAGGNIGERPGDGVQTQSLHLSSFLALQFHFAHITLLRVAIIFPHNSYVNEVSRHAALLNSTSASGGPSSSSYTRLQNGAMICASAARATITQTLHLADQGVRSPAILGATPPFLAANILALTILRQPARRLARADLELLNLATEHVEDHFSRWVRGRDAESFVEGCAVLRDRIGEAFAKYHASPSGSVGVVGGQGPAATPLTADTAGTGSGDAYARNGEPVQDGISQQEVLPGGGSTATAFPSTVTTSHGASGVDELPSELFEDLQFDELWGMMGDDFLIGTEQIYLS